MEMEMEMEMELEMELEMDGIGKGNGIGKLGSHLYNNYILLCRCCYIYIRVFRAGYCGRRCTIAK